MTNLNLVHKWRAHDSQISCTPFQFHFWFRYVFSINKILFDAIAHIVCHSRNISLLQIKLWFSQNFLKSMNRDNYKNLLPFSTYPETSSLGISWPKASAMSLDPILAMHWRARETWTGFLLARSFLMDWTISWISSELPEINTEMNK